MPDSKGCLIERVLPGSPAERAGIEPGFRMLRIDGQPVSDIIDFKIAESDGRLRLMLLAPDGRLRRVTINKDPKTPLGLQFDPPTMTPVRLCGNRCLFCFVDQNPRGLRPALYLKDDDYRLSFLYGNFITLNNLDGSDLERILSLRLSPLYISVHTTDPQLRSRLFGTARAARGLDILRRLARSGIMLHLQVVLCPGVNTGAALKRTVRDLARLGSAVASIALVPVGLTDHRPDSSKLFRFGEGEAREMVEWVTRLQRRFIASSGRRLIFAADEFYNLAGIPFPAADCYEGFPQLENGVGLARRFLDELEQLPAGLAALPENIPPVTAATGKEAAGLVEMAAEQFRQIYSIELRTMVVDNRFFGPSVTVAGLLTGSDLLAALEGKDPGAAVLIPRSMLKDGSELFLDGMTLSGLAGQLQVPVMAAGGPAEMLELIGRLPAVEAIHSREVTGG